MMSDMGQREFEEFVDLVYKYTRIRMNESKRALLVNRLGKRVRDLGLRDFKAYRDHLVLDEGEKIRFIDAVTTNETFFFRAPKVWEYFSQTMLKSIAEKARAKPLQIWCGAASSGDEPYTIAMLCEEFAASHARFTWQLHASDISTDMLERCRQGQYAGRAIEKIDPRLLKKYFEPKDGTYRVRDALKRKVRFFRHRLQDPPPMAGLDIVFLRNVMIYFDAETKDAMLSAIYDALAPGGYLVVGESEGLVNIKAPFRYLVPSVYQKEEAR